MTRIEFTIEIPSAIGVGLSEIEDAPDGWADMTEAERNAWASEVLAAHVAEFAPSGWHVLDDDAEVRP